MLILTAICFRYEGQATTPSIQSIYPSKSEPTTWHLIFYAIYRKYDNQSMGFYPSSFSIMSYVVLSHGLDAERPHLPFRYTKYILKIWEQHFEPIKKM